MSNSHIMKTTAQWAETSAQYMLIGEGTLCIELMPDNTMNIKIGDGVRLFHELPYISDTNIDLHEYAKIEYVDAQIDIVDREIGDVASDVSGLNQEVVALQEDAHTHENKNVLDQTTAPYTTEEHDKLSGIEDHANNYSLPIASNETLGGVKTGYHLEVDSDGKLNVLDIPTEMIGATESVDGVGGTVPAPVTGQQAKFLRGDGTWATPQGGGGTVTVDDVLSTTSENPVQNKVITLQINTMIEDIGSLETTAHTHDNKNVLDQTTAVYTIDEKSKLGGIENHANNYTLPTASDTTLGGVKIGTGLHIDVDSILSVTIDDVLSSTSANPVQNNVIYTALQSKADLVDGKVPTSQLPPETGGVSSVTTGTGANGTIEVVTNGETTNPAVRGLLSAAYTESTAYLSSSTKYAISNSIGGAANQAKQVYGTFVDYGAINTRYVPFAEDASGGYKDLYFNNAIYVQSRYGTVDHEGIIELFLGNNIAAATDQNKTGAISIYGNGNYRGRITIADGLTENRLYSFPNASGEVALTTSTVSSANTLNVSDTGSATQPIYFVNGVPQAITYTIASNVPSDAVFTDTTYAPGTGLSLSGTTINHENSIAPGTAAGSSGTLEFGGTFNIPSVTYDATGHITAKGTTSLTMPSVSVTDTKVRASLDDNTSIAYLLGTTTSTSSMPIATEAVVDANIYIDTVAGKLHATTFEGNGNGLTSLNATNIASGTLNLARTATSGVTAGSYGLMANATPGFGDTFNVPYVTVDQYGRTTAASTKSVTIPATVATTTVAGLMPASAVSKLSGIDDNANNYSLPTASTTTLGGIKVGSNLSIDVTGVLSATDTVYTLPTASTTTLGGIKVGSNLSIDADGVLSATDTVYTHPSATAYSSGLYKITTNSTGHVTSATAVVKADITALGIPASNTTYTAGTGLSLSGNTFNHSNSITAGTASGSSGDIAYGGSINIPSITYDAQGHIKSTSTTAVTLPDEITYTGTNGITVTDHVIKHSNAITAGTVAGSSGNVAFGGSITIPKITYDAQGHISGTTTTAVTLPSNPNTDEHVRVSVTDNTNITYLMGTNTASSAMPTTTVALIDPNVYIDTTAGLLHATSFSGSGASLSALNATNITSGTLNAARLSTSGVTAGSYGLSENTTPSFGGQFSVPYLTIDNKGRVTAASSKSVTVPNTVASSSANGLMTSAHFTKLGGIASGAEVNQNAYSTMKIGSTSISATGKTDTFTFVQGNNITLTPNATNKTLTLAVPDMRYTLPIASSSTLGGIKVGTNLSISNGVLSATDTVYTHPSATAYSSGLYKITTNSTGHVTKAVAVVKSDITALGIPGTDTVYTLPTATANMLGGIKVGSNLSIDVTGVLSATDTVYTHPSATAYSSGLYKITTNNTGHVTSATAVVKADITALGIPASNTTYTAGTGLSLSGNTFNHSNSITAGTASGSTGSIAFGGSITIPAITYDAQGHIKSKTTTTVTLPSNPNTDAKVRQDSSITNQYRALLMSSSRASDPADITTATDLVYMDAGRELYAQPSTGSLYAKAMYADGKEVSTEGHAHDAGEIAWGLDTNYHDSSIPNDPVLSAFNERLNPNRFAFANTSGITLEYSRDGGTTWTAFGSDTTKTALVTTTTSVAIGNATSGITIDDMVRVTFAFAEMQVFSILRGAFIYVTTNGATGSYVLPEIQYGGATAWINLIDADKPAATTPVTGLSGWNWVSLKGKAYGSYKTTAEVAATHVAKLRLTFGITGIGETGASSLKIQRIYSYGGYGWATPSNLARINHLYDYDESQNANFPNNVTAADHFIANGNTVYNMFDYVATPVDIYGGNTGGVRVAFGGGATTVVGAGEAKDRFKTITEAAGEYLYLVSDQAIYFWSDCDTFDNRKGACYDNGDFRPEIKDTGSLGTDTYHWNAAYINTVYGTLSGNASTATALTSNAGSVTQPIYFSGGKPVATTYTLKKSVPSTAIFTDTNVEVNATTTANYRSLLLGYDANGDPQALGTGTGITYRSLNLYAQPSTGTIFATNFNGNATSATYATNVRVANIVPGSRTLLCPAIVSGYSNNEYSSNTRELTANGGIKFALREGSATVNGQADLLLGTSIAVETVNNKKGRVFLYGEGTGFTCLHPLNTSSTDYSNGIPAVPGQLGVVEVLYTGSATSSNSVSLTNAHLYDWYYVKIMSGGITQLIVANGCASTGTTYTQCAVGLSPPPTQYTGMQIASALVSVTTNSLTVNFTAVAMSMSASGVVASSSLTAPNILMVYGVRGSA